MMTEVSEELKNLELTEHIFRDVKYYVTGDVDEKVLEFLKAGGAERMNYFSDYVTHLICGIDAEETDLSDASEIYEIPAVTVKWVIYSAQLKRLLSTKPYLYNTNKLFSNLTFCFSNVGKDRAVLWAIITYNGGIVQLNLDRNCNYLVTTSTSTEKYLKASSENITVVTPDWVLESVHNKNFVEADLFHPSLIAWPKVVKHESTTAITGFEPDEVNVNEGNLDNILPDSTQALLEELKQRMPWNQPQVSSSTEVVPPNVVAPSYTNSKLPQLQEINQQQSVQQRLFGQQQQLNIQKQAQLPSVSFASNQQQQPSQQPQQQLNFLPSTSQVPRSIIHHPPQTPVQNQQQTQLQFSVNQQVAFSQASLTPSQRLRIIEQMQQNRAQRLSQQNQFNQLQQQRTQITQQVSQLQQESQMGQVNQQQQQQPATQVNQLRQTGQPQQVSQSGQQLILTSQNQLLQNQPNQQLTQENQQQLLQNIQTSQQLIQSPQLRQINQSTSQQVTSMAQLQMVQSQQQQHSNLGQIAKSPSALQQQQHLSTQQLLQRQIQNQHLLKNQHILQNQLNQQQQNQINQQPGQVVQQTQINQQLLQNQQQLATQNQLQLNQQNLEQQLVQNQLNQQQPLNQRQLNQLNQHLLQNQLVQQQQQLGQNQVVQQQIGQNQINQQQQQQIRQTQIGAQQQQQLTQLSQQQINQNRLNIQQQQQPQSQNKIIQNQFGQQQIISQQTVVVSQNQQNVLQQQFGSPNSQQFNQQNFVQTSPFNQGQQQQPQQLIQTQQGQQQPQQQPIKTQQIIGQPQLVNQKLNIQQIGGQQHILLQQQQQQNQSGQNNQGSPQRPASAHIWQQQQPAPPPPPPTPQQPQQQMNIQRHPNAQAVQTQGPRVQWAPNQQPGVLPQRQYIHLDEQTHQQLQQMSPEDRARFVQKLHKHRQQVLQNRMQQQHQQRAGHILIRGGVPLGLNSQQQMQWLQQAKQQGVVLQQNIQQTVPQGTIVQQSNPNIQHAPGLSPIQQQPQAFTDQNQQLQLQRQQQQQLMLQQLQLHQQQQREQVQKTVLQQQQPQAPPPPPLQQQQVTVVRPLSQTQIVEGPAVVAAPPSVVVDPNVVQSQNPLVNSKTKTALANMLNTRLQSGGSTLTENIPEQSAAGTLKLMTAQHNAALNSGNRPHDLLFFQSRRIINRPNGEVIRPPPATSVPPSPQGEPPKLQYSPRNSLPLQHRPGTYYGHNPNLKLPPDLFLLGCVFVVVELERFLDESMPGWQKKIEKHGGEIEKQYCNRVTHVICETQRHGVVMQALRDFKRCVTLYWLSDVINRKQVLPPWIALHLPTMYWDTAPASKHLICLTGFVSTERDRVKHMIKYIGAGLTTYFSKHNTLLITTKADGPKYSHAKKWGVPVVNVQWLTDIMLGHFSALNQTEHAKYQHFTDPPNFSFDPLLVPNLMHAWKMPINISQESYEKVKRSASPVVMPPSKPKKMKTEHGTDENDNEEDMMMMMKGTYTHRILFSMCADVEELKKIVRQLGGTIAKTFRDCTHLIMPQLKRTHKLLCCICVGTYVLPDSWLRDSQAAGKFLDESNYSLDTKEFNSEFRCDFNQTLATKNRNRLFEGKYFFITPSVVPRKKELIELTQCCGGVVEKTRRTLAQIEATNVNSPYSYVILTHENDLHLVADLLKNKKDKVRIVCNSELILSAILKQTFEVEPYAVKFL